MPKIPTIRPTTWAEHKTKWKSCTGCDLCEGRDKVVLLRGKVPADILFVGEAPGMGENVGGSPFSSESGILLDEIIDTAIELSGVSPRLAFTNLVACIPLDESGNKVSVPPKEAIKACKPRLQELVEILEPRAIVMVGKVSQKWCPQVIDYGFEDSADIIHPAGLMRLDASQYPIAVQRTIVVLRDLFERMR